MQVWEVASRKKHQTRAKAIYNLIEATDAGRRANRSIKIDKFRFIAVVC